MTFSIDVVAGAEDRVIAMMSMWRCGSGASVVGIVVWCEVERKGREFAADFEPHHP